jgi:hypothetical protein
MRLKSHHVLGHKSIGPDTDKPNQAEDKQTEPGRDWRLPFLGRESAGAGAFFEFDVAQSYFMQFGRDKWPTRGTTSAWIA